MYMFIFGNINSSLVRIVNVIGTQSTFLIFPADKMHIIPRNEFLDMVTIVDELVSEVHAKERTKLPNLDMYGSSNYLGVSSRCPLKTDDVYSHFKVVQF